MLAMLHWLNLTYLTFPSSLIPPGVTLVSQLTEHYEMMGKLIIGTELQEEQLSGDNNNWVLTRTEHIPQEHIYIYWECWLTPYTTWQTTTTLESANTSHWFQTLQSYINVFRWIEQTVTNSPPVINQIFMMYEGQSTVQIHVELLQNYFQPLPAIYHWVDA